MLYITYTDTNIDQFLTYDRTQVKVEVAPVYQHLRLAMNLDKKMPEVKAKDFNSKKLSTEYLGESRPVVVRQMAAEWDAIKNWNLQYLDEKCGSTTSIVSALFRRDDKEPWNRVMKEPMMYP